ncbi:MAG TPA: hypothetical protein DEQ38_00545 [Elusimicrobia bacterium]|nr:MAG: hypothetical protein A2089_01375 [Elusimicrobia bacterium GWD2_63_28]HCC46601.1 hypothetical protein [Elusimicrobiota bacterium]
MKYWAYVNNEILGPFEKEKLLELPSFSPALLVCPQTPVGEKTEDWKEASTYPELSALAGGQAAPAAQATAPEVSPEAAAQPQVSAQPAIETPSLSFKPLSGAQAVDPVPPASHLDGMAEITVNRLGKSGVEPAPAAVSQPHQASANFDPISLSQIVRRTETLSGQDAPRPAEADGLALEPHNFSQAAPSPAPAPSLDFGAASSPSPFAAAAEPVPAPSPFAAPEPAPAAAAAAPSQAPVTDVAGLETLIQRLDALSRSSATRQDLSAAVDPLRLKLDQMGEVISSIKNSQFQREVMDKLNYLENAVGELKTSFRSAPREPEAAKPQEMQIERNSDTVFGAQPVKPAEKPKAEPAKEPAKAEIKDEGSKPSKIGPALKKIFKSLLTLVLLAAVLIGGLIGAKKFAPPELLAKAPPGILAMIPSFGAPAEQPAPAPEQPAQPEQAQAAATEQPAAPEQQQAEPTPEEKRQEESRAAAQEQVKAAQQQVPPESVPEIIYITRTYKLKATASTLENKMFEHAAKAGGNYNRTEWKVRKAATPGLAEIDAVIPAKSGPLTYTFTVDREKKHVQPVNADALAVYAALAKESARKPAAKKPARPKAAPKAAPKPAAKPAAKAEPQEEDGEYEYVYVDEDEAGE